jgi:hypothetical protein
MCQCLTVLAILLRHDVFKLADMQDQHLVSKCGLIGTDSYTTA